MEEDAEAASTQSDLPRFDSDCASGKPSGHPSVCTLRHQLLWLHLLPTCFILGFLPGAIFLLFQNKPITNIPVVIYMHMVQWSLS